MIAAARLLAVVMISGSFAAWAGEPGSSPTAPATTPPPPVTLPDGTVVTTNADGSKTSQYEPGSTYTQTTDGSKTIGETTRGADGQPVVTKTTYNPTDGTRKTEYPNDPTKKPIEEKPTSVRTNKKGNKIFTYQDQTKAVFEEDGDFRLEKVKGREHTEYKYGTDGSRRIDVKYDFFSGAPALNNATVAAIIDTRTEHNVCIAGNVNPDNLSKSFYQHFGSSVNYSLKSLGSMAGYGHVYSTNAPLASYHQWLQKSGFGSCQDFDGELNFCTIMTPLTAYRGHAHAHEHGGLHSHDAPDPPLNWGREPPEVVIRLDWRARDK